MTTIVARVASEGVDYFNILQSVLKKRIKSNRPSEEIVFKADGLDFSWGWDRSMIAKHKTDLGRVYRVTISNSDRNKVIVDSNVTDEDERKVDCHEDLIDALRHFKKEIKEKSIKVAQIIAKKWTLSLGGVAIPMKPIIGDDCRGDWRFTYNGPFKLEVYGEGNFVDRATLYARRADTTKRVSATLNGKILIKDLQKKLDEVIAANKLILSAPESAKTKGTVKIGDEVLEVNVTSLKLFQRHIVNLQKLYGKKGSK